MAGETAMAANKILFVGDDPRVGDLFRAVAQNCGYDACIVPDAPTCKRALAFFDPTVISLDFDAPRTDGAALLQFFADSNCKAWILIASRLRERVVNPALLRGKEHGLNTAGEILKPMSTEHLRATLMRLRVRLQP